ncbi:MAG: hypothetical protein AB8G96_09585 [Phycisphaerales bacterium]
MRRRRLRRLSLVRTLLAGLVVSLSMLVIGVTACGVSLPKWTGGACKAALGATTGALVVTVVDRARFNGSVRIGGGPGRGGGLGSAGTSSIVIRRSERPVAFRVVTGSTYALGLAMRGFAAAELWGVVRSW